MKRVFLVVLAIGLVYWLSNNTFRLPGVGLVQLSWPAAMLCVAMLYAIFVLIPWLANPES
jgi:hypothetical protein